MNESGTSNNTPAFCVLHDAYGILHSFQPTEMVSRSSFEGGWFAFCMYVHFWYFSGRGSMKTVEPLDI
jgi:hypothetical protein